MITEDYVSFETAKLLKEKGFDESCFRYAESKEIYESGDWMVANVTGGAIGVPTLQMTMKWLREVHKIHIAIGYTFKADANLADDYVSYCFGVENAKTFFYHSEDKWHNTYEEACEAAIKYCLENLI